MNHQLIDIDREICRKITDRLNEICDTKFKKKTDFYQKLSNRTGLKYYSVKNISFHFLGANLVDYCSRHSRKYADRLSMIFMILEISVDDEIVGLAGKLNPDFNYPLNYVRAEQ